MKKFYIASFDGKSGVCRYASDFYTQVLQPLDYTHIDSALPDIDILSLVSSKDVVHFEIGIFQKKEVGLLLTMLKAGYQFTTITLHDPPILKYPFLEFSRQWLNQASKAYDIFIGRFLQTRPLLKKIKRIYVLSHMAETFMRTKFGLQNVFYLPHIVNTQRYEPNNIITGKKNFLSLGFIGSNKGLAYALRLQQLLLENFPDLQFYVVGQALGKKEQNHLERLKQRFTRNVHFLGYVPEEKLKPILDQTMFAFQLFQDYRFFKPVSGSVLQMLNAGKVVFANDVNTVRELIKHGHNGFILTGNLKQDLKLVKAIFTNDNLVTTTIENTRQYLAKYHSASVISKHLHPGHVVLSTDCQLQ